MTTEEPPTKYAHCGTCGVLGTVAEMHRMSLPVPGSLPVTPNAVTTTCRDEAACTARVMNKHRNDALITSDDPLYAAGNVLARVREGLHALEFDLAAAQGAIGRARVQYLQEPDEASVDRAARVIAEHFTGSALSAQDPMFGRVARAVIKAARFDAEEPPPPPAPVPDAVLDAMGNAMSALMEPNDDWSYDDLARAAVAAIPADLWAKGQQ